MVTREMLDSLVDPLLPASLHTLRKEDPGTPCFRHPGQRCTCAGMR